MIGLEELNRKKAFIEKENLLFIKKLKRRPPVKITEEVQELDTKVFKNYDCTTCANCCKTISPIFKNKDIDRLASHFKLKPGAFTEKYLKMDQDGDYVLLSSPCPFLKDNNYCSVYDVRPAACKNYPHTGSLPVTKSWDLLVKNSAVCPAVNEIVNELKNKYNQKGK